MVVVMDFKKADFTEFYKRINQKSDPIFTKHASEGRIQNVSVVWDKDFEIGLHLWDIKAFHNVVNLEKFNFVFRADNFEVSGKNLKYHNMRDL